MESRFLLSGFALYLVWHSCIAFAFFEHPHYNIILLGSMTLWGAMICLWASAKVGQ